MSGIERMAADACISGTPYARTTVTDDEVLVIPDEMVGKFCWFQAVTSDVAVRFGDSSVSVAISARSSESSGVLTAEGSEPHLYIVAGTTVQWRIPSDVTHMAHVSEDTSGVFRFGLAQGEYPAD